MSRNKMTVCPHCGAEIPVNAPACRECGSDERTGWASGTYLDGIDLGDDFDYDEMAEKEFGTGEKTKRHSLQIAVGVLLIAAFVLMLIRSFF